MTAFALSELLGATVYDPTGAAGRVREVALAPQEDRARISSLIVKTRAGNRVLPFAAVSNINGGIRATTAAGEWHEANGTEGLFLLERDLLDQQVIDVNGRKVVRVNDVDLARAQLASAFRVFKPKADSLHAHTLADISLYSTRSFTGPNRPDLSSFGEAPVFCRIAASGSLP